jgi:hypothetical protein
MDKRTKNNMTAEQRRVIHRNYKKKKARGASVKTALDHAKRVLWKHGHEVWDAAIADPRFEGSYYVDTRRKTVVQVIEMAKEIEEREARRNAELRKERGLK